MDTEERILWQTLELFKLHGIRRVTMDQISAELGMSKRTIYEMFTDRDTLVGKTLEYAMKREREDLLGIIDGAANVIEALYLIGKDGQQKRARINVLFFEDIRKYYRRFLETRKHRKGIMNTDITFTLLKRGMDEGVFLPELDIDVVNNFLQQMMNLVHNLEIVPDPMNAEKLIIRNIFLPYFRGISTSKGRELLEEYFAHQNP